MGAITPSLTEFKYIQLDPQGRPIIAGTKTKVIEVVMAQMAHGWSPEEIHFQYPYLSMGQIHSALAYYWDRKEELDAAIESSYQYAKAMRRQAGPSQLAVRLRAQGLLR